MANPRFSNLFRALVALGLFGIAGCDLLKSPAARLSAVPDQAEPVPAAPPSAESEALRIYYAKVQANLLNLGMLRTDGGRRDAPFTDRVLADNFIKIATYDEFTTTANGLTSREKPSTIRKWVAPVRIGLRFGASVPQAQRATDTASVVAYAAQLSRATRHPISVVATSPNFVVEIVNQDERRALGPEASASLDDLSSADLQNLTTMPQSTYCQVFTQTKEKTGIYTRAFAVIRAEHPDLLRLSCLQEEIAQALGLPNDSPQARPSIFNDNDEFALLTPQDELMLRMLYDPSLTPGMTAEQARPIALALATRILGGES